MEPVDPTEDRPIWLEVMTRTRTGSEWWTRWRGLVAKLTPRIGLVTDFPVNWSIMVWKGKVAPDTILCIGTTNNVTEANEALLRILKGHGALTKERADGRQSGESKGPERPPEAS